MNYNTSMLTPRTFTIFSLVLLGLSATWIVLTRPAPGVLENPSLTLARPGFQAPDFELQTLTGESVSLSSLRGKPVILNLWASWCPPCQAEMPSFQHVYEDYHERGVVILAVNLTLQDREEDARQFVLKNHLSFPVLLDSGGNVERLYSTRALPTTYFISADGIIRERVIGGPIAEALLRAQVERLLHEAP
ncbi:peroxiredoxin [Anaerolinea thermolimosa]|nr:peroxiredoxin [Anaerolinea thermolimosa]